MARMPGRKGEDLFRPVRAFSPLTPLVCQRVSFVHMIRAPMILRSLLPLVALVASLLAQEKQENPDRHRPFPGFKIAGNLYYAGTADLAVYLINTPSGNILINSDFKED